MRNLKTKKTMVASAAAALALCGGVVAASPGGATGPSVYLRVTAASVPLSPSGAEVGLTSVSVPAGTWVVTAKANPVNFGAADYVRCRILVGGAQKDAGATLVGNAAPAPTGELGPSVATIALQTAFTSTGAKTVGLKCQHDFPLAGQYVDPGASLMVVKASGPLG